MPVFSRLGPYDRARLDRIAGHGTGKIDRRLVEYWAHEASLIPVDLHPLFRWRMADVDREAWGSISRIAREQPELVARDARAGRRATGRSGRATPAPCGRRRGPGTCGTGTRARSRSSTCSSPARSPPPGGSTSSGSTTSTERVLPDRDPDAADARPRRTRSASWCGSPRGRSGVATEPDLGDYFRLPRAASKARVAELVDAGELEPVAGRRAGRRRRTCGRTPAGRAGSTPARCCRRSTR